MLPFTFAMNDDNLKKLTSMTPGYMSYYKYDHRITNILEELIPNVLAIITHEYIPKLGHFRIAGRMIYASGDLSFSIIDNAKSITCIDSGLYTINYHKFLVSRYNDWMYRKYNIENYLDDIKYKLVDHKNKDKNTVLLLLNFLKSHDCKCGTKCFGDKLKRIREIVDTDITSENEEQMLFHIFFFKLLLDNGFNMKQLEEYPKNEYDLRQELRQIVKMIEACL